MELDVEQQMPMNLYKIQVLYLISEQEKHVYRIDLYK